MVQTDLLKALKENHVAEIEAEGQAFDPNMHQAVQTVPADDDHPADTVVQVLQKGYILKDRVLRPAMVIVAQ
jgi:molecular chaperone GrpE